MASGLITKNTDLKSLKYGSMPLGSDKPYVTKNIGQSPGSQIGSEITHRIDDVSRIAQMLVGRPGIKYLLHEAELQQIGVGQRIKKAQQGGKSLVGAVLGQLGNTAINTLKIAGSTLAQVPVNGTGTHFLKGFRTDTYLQPSGGNNRSAFAQFFGAGGLEGAPLALEGKPITGVAKETNFGTEKNGNFTVDSKISKEYGYDSKVFNGKELKDYDEIQNREIPADKYLGKFSSKLGKPITIDTGSIAPKDPLVKTKLQQSKAGDKQVGTIGVLEAGAPPALGGSTLIYDYKNTLTGTTAEDASIHAQAGAPIKVIPSGSTQRDTTVAAGDPNSLVKGISNLDVSSSTLGDNGNTPLSKTYANTQTDSYTGSPSETNINAAVSGTPIKVVPSGSTQRDTTSTAGDPNSLVRGISNLDVSPSTLGDNGNTPLSKIYTNTQTGSYTGFTSETNINAAVTGSNIGTGGTVPKNEIQYKYGSIEKANQAAEKNNRSQPNEELGKEYTDSSTYSQEQAKRLIGNSTKRTQKESRVGLGDQGKTTKATVDYWTPAKSNERDQVNMLDVGDRQDAAQGARDLAKFYFEIITPDESKFLYFRAHIKSIDDSFNADWQAHKYVGRAENFYTYGGFDRDINVSFTIAAATRSEMRPLYRKMVYLASATAPTYGTSGLMRGTLARLTVGSYLDQIPGVITSVKFNIDNNVPWEIAMGQPEGVENDVQVLPMVMECSISFKPIHDFAPQTGLYHYFTNSHEGVKFF